MTDEDFERIERARTIRAETVDARGTPAEEYLAARSLSVTDAIRYHPACPWRNEAGNIDHIPAIVVPFTSISDDTITGIHRISLTKFLATGDTMKTPRARVLPQASLT